MTFDPLTSDTQAPVQRSVHSYQVNGVDVVIVHYLQLLPRDWSRLTLQQVQTCDITDILTSSQQTGRRVKNVTITARDASVPMFQETLGELVSDTLMEMCTVMGGLLV